MGKAEILFPYSLYVACERKWKWSRANQLEFLENQSENFLECLCMFRVSRNYYVCFSWKKEFFFCLSIFGVHLSFPPTFSMADILWLCGFSIIRKRIQSLFI